MDLFLVSGDFILGGMLVKFDLILKKILYNNELAV